MTLLEVVISAEQSNRISCTKVICPFEFRFVRLMQATPAIIITEPIICQIPATSLKRTIPSTKERTAEITFVTVTTEMSAFFKTFKIINQLNANKKPFSAKIRTNLIGIAIPIGSQIRLNKKAVVVNITKITESLLFLIENFLKIL